MNREEGFFLSKSWKPHSNPEGMKESPLEGNITYSILIWPSHTAPFQGLPPLSSERCLSHLTFTASGPFTDRLHPLSCWLTYISTSPTYCCYI